MTTPSPAEQLCEQAKTARDAGRLNEAIAFFEQAITVDERCLPAWEGRAYTAFQAKDYPRAIECFRKVSMLDVRRAPPMTNLGAVYNRIGDYQNATKALRQAISRDRKSAEAYYNLGIAHKGLHQLSLAVSAYKEAVKFNPAMHDAHQNLANVYFEMGNVTLAKQHYEKALEIRPDFEPARRGLRRIEEAAVVQKEKYSPFGRLVDTKELEKRDVSVGNYRKLTLQEKNQDREDNHRMSRDAVAAAEAICENLQENILPRIQTLVGLVGDNQDRQSLSRNADVFVQVKHQFDEQVDALLRVTDELRRHEEFIRKG